MLEVFVDLLGSLLLSITGFYIIKKIISSQEKLFVIQNVLFILLLSFITILLHKAEYTGVESLTIFIINIIIYKLIFKISFEESTISVGLMMIVMFLSDLITALLLTYFYSFNTIRNTIFLTLVADFSVCMINISIIRIKIILNQISKFYTYCKAHYSIGNTIFLIMLMIGLCISAYNITASEIFSLKYVLNTLMMTSLGTITYIFVKNRNSYNELTDEYDSLFSYIQNFEEWIEKEQLNRHEYKNQLAVLRCLTKEKKVKEKIDEILEDNINIEGEVIHQLKQLPKGGIKGLMYYKVAIGQKKKVKITADVSLETKSILNQLTEQEIRIVCKLIGIYLDNAIEAAEETRKKNLLIEVYELSNKVCFVFSNTFKKKDNFNDRNKKGVTTKGEGHGNGLYFASKLIEENNFLEAKQDVVDGYYIQQLIIKRKESK